jgi:hypothetical protein
MMSSALVGIATLALIVFALPAGIALLAVLVRRRPSVDDISDAASARGWRFQRRPNWSGGRTAFEIEGSTHDGTAWVLDSFNVGINRNWTVGLKLRFPGLAGGWDFAVLPRERRRQGSEFGEPVDNAAAQLASLRTTVAEGLDFLARAHEMPVGVPAFDAVYKVLVSGDGTPDIPRIGSALAERFIEWPPPAITPRSMAAWRDRFGFHVEARLWGTPNWPTVSHLLALAEDLRSRLPVPRS